MLAAGQPLALWCLRHDPSAGRQLSSCQHSKRTEAADAHSTARRGHCGGCVGAAVCLPDPRNDFFGLLDAQQMFWTRIGNKSYIFYADY